MGKWQAKAQEGYERGMDLKAALIGQYRAGLAMLRQCVERCPDDLWASAPNGHPRTFWRIAYHTAFYTHLYLMQEEASFVPWSKHSSQGVILWDDDEEGMPPEETTYSRTDVLGYLSEIEGSLEGWVNGLDLDTKESGFSWYSIPKLDHQILNIRHLGVHVGQLQELLYAKGIDLDWKS